jgi:predicted phage terminase large subunit-like protein
VFFETPGRYKIVTKGRRLGFTHGLANFVIDSMLDGEKKLLWVDTVHGNIDRYIERYFMPTLRNLPKNYWDWRQQKKELSINGSLCDFRSADRPENMEGFGYNTIILNEAGIILKNRYLWENAIRPMALDYSADVIIGGTPKGKKHKGAEHLYYELFKKCVPAEQAGPDDKWVSFCFSTYDNPLIPPEEIDEIVADVSASIRNQEIFGQFIDDPNSGIFKESWWQYYREQPKVWMRIVQSWDTAFKSGRENDYSVCTTWMQTKTGFYLLDVLRRRMEFPDLKRAVVDCYEKYKPNIVLIEDAASGQSLIQEIKRKTSIPLKPIKPDRDKIARAHAVTPTIEAGNVYLPETAEWKKDFIDECTEFADVEHDDQVDSMTQALEEMIGNALSIEIVTNTKKRESVNRIKGF